MFELQNHQDVVVGVHWDLQQPGKLLWYGTAGCYATGWRRTEKVKVVLSRVNYKSLHLQEESFWVLAKGFDQEMIQEVWVTACWALLTILSTSQSAARCFPVITEQQRESPLCLFQSQHSTSLAYTKLRPSLSASVIIHSAHTPRSSGWTYWNVQTWEGWQMS